MRDVQSVADTLHMEARPRLAGPDLVGGEESKSIPAVCPAALVVQCLSAESSMKFLTSADLSRR